MRFVNSIPSPRESHDYSKIVTPHHIRTLYRAPCQWAMIAQAIDPIYPQSNSPFSGLRQYCQKFGITVAVRQNTTKKGTYDLYVQYDPQSEHAKRLAHKRGEHA